MIRYGWNGSGNNRTYGFLTTNTDVSLSFDGKLSSLTSGSSLFISGKWLTVVGGESSVSNETDATISAGGTIWTFSLSFGPESAIWMSVLLIDGKEDHIKGGFSVTSAISNSTTPRIVASRRCG